MRPLPALPSALTTGWWHLRRDVLHALVLLLRLLPRRAKRPLGAFVSVGSRERPVWPMAAALSRWDSGDRDAASQLLARASATGRGKARRAARLGAALRLGDATAAALRHLPDDDPRRSALEALDLWQRGDLVEALSRVAADVPDREVRRMHRWMAAEVAVLQRPTPSGRVAFNRSGGDAVRGRVLHLVTNSLPHTAAGYTIRSHNIGRAQRAAGLDPHFVTRLGYPGTKGVWQARGTDVVDGLSYHHLLPPTGVPELADRRVDADVAHTTSLTRRLRPTALHAASNHVNGFVALEVGAELGLPVVYEVRGFLEESWLAGRDAAARQTDRYVLAREAETRCMRAADAVVTLGQVMKREIESRGIAASSVTVIPNAVDDAFLAPLPPQQPARLRYGATDDDVVVGAVSTLYRFEGLEVLVRAVRLLRARGSKVRLLLVGDGEQAGTLRRLVDELGIGDVTSMPGRIPHARVREVYAALDVFVVPRTDDRVCHLVTPLKPVEAMASSLPVVASDVGGLRELVTHDQTGLLVPPEDPERLADALEQLVQDRHRRLALGAAGHQSVREERVWSRQAVRYRELYERLSG